MVPFFDPSSRACAPLIVAAAIASAGDIFMCVHANERTNGMLLVGELPGGLALKLQHGQQLRGKVERLLQAAGYSLTPVEDAHLCCGSAGTNSLLQPETANELRVRKLGALEAGTPRWIATANIGCLTHLQGATQTPVRHWIELIDTAQA